MSEERERSAWDRTATTIAHLLSAQTGQEFAPVEFNPYRRDDLPGLDATSPENLQR